MELVRLDRLEPRHWPVPAVSAGNFDGVHRGHQALVAAALRDARAAHGTAVVLTFDPHPSRVLSPDRAPASLMTLEQKAEVLATLGVAKLAVLPFDRRLSEQSPEEFAGRVLRGALGARVVVVGANFRFGKGRAGDLKRLRALGRKLGFRVHGLDPVVHEGAPISSTRIREALARGAVAPAREMLGRAFFIDGDVVAGEGRGRGLGFPTANLASENETLPVAGVYACRARLLGDSGEAERPAVVNVGRRPTFGAGDTRVEAHLIGFAGDLYGRRLRLSFVERLREERAFAGPEALVDQIQQDAAQAARLLEKA
jgi:riboflavin kinase/FMN adenylyltransferase